MVLFVPIAICSEDDAIYSEDDALYLENKAYPVFCTNFKQIRRKPQPFLYFAQKYTLKLFLCFPRKGRHTRTSTSQPTS